MPFNVCPSCKVYHDPKTDRCDKCGYFDEETKRAIVAKYVEGSAKTARGIVDGLPINWTPVELECTSCGSKDMERSVPFPFSGNSLSGVVRCKACGRRDSVMNDIARRAFPVQKMPDGAVPFYGRDVGVSEIVAAPTVLHLKELSEWNSGPDIRKCTECGVRLWSVTDGVWTDDRRAWESPPEGHVSCGSLPKDR